MLLVGDVHAGGVDQAGRDKGGAVRKARQRADHAASDGDHRGEGGLQPGGGARVDHRPHEGGGVGEGVVDDEPVDERGQRPRSARGLRRRGRSGGARRCSAGRC